MGLVIGDVGGSTSANSAPQLIDLAPGDPLPATLEGAPVFLDVVSMDADLDASTWAPIGLDNGAMIRLRKMDNSSHKILFGEYKYIDQYREFITLIYFESTGLQVM